LKGQAGRSVRNLNLYRLHAIRVPANYQTASLLLQLFLTGEVNCNVAQWEWPHEGCEWNSVTCYIVIYFYAL